MKLLQLAGSAYLTGREVSPMGVRSMAMSIFHAFGLALAGACRPAIFGHLIASESRKATLMGIFSVGC